MWISARAQQLLRPGIEHETLQPPRFRARDPLTTRRHAEVPAPLVRIRTALRSADLDEAVGEHSPQRAIEVAGKNALVHDVALNGANKCPAVLRLVQQCKQRLEDQRFEHR